MIDPSLVTRREALFSTAVLGVVATVADANPAVKTADADPSEKDGAIRQGKQKFEIRVRLDSGQVIMFQSTEVFIDFGAAGILHVTPSGVLPAANRSGKR